MMDNNYRYNAALYFQDLSNSSIDAVPRWALLVIQGPFTQPYKSSNWKEKQRFYQK
jgi:hypothetical protein